MRHIFITRQVKVNLTRFFATSAMSREKETIQTITEGKASVKTSGKVFYNPVQEFNRDLSIAVLTAFVKNFKTGKEKARKNAEINVILNKSNHDVGVKNEDGIVILEALSATGLRSIRYAKEIGGIKEIIANDISQKAVESIKENILENNVADLVTASFNDATMLMYQHRIDQFDAIDLDPYGCPSIFLDSAIQSIKNGGILLVTATDMAVLAGNSPETCYSKYGSISLRIKSCHEMALRILLQCIESHANRYGKYIEPLLSISADFYVRVFVRVFESAHKCKYTLSKLSTVYHCGGCGSFELQPLGVIRKNEKNGQDKFCLPTWGGVGEKCVHCGHSYHVGGPIWSAPIHDKNFVRLVLDNAPNELGTYKRIKGILSVVLEELDDPLYYTLDKLAGTLHVEVPPMLTVRSAILNAGFKVSYTHGNKYSIKTDAPGKVIWDIMRCWVKSHPVSQKRLTPGTPVEVILREKPEKDYSFEIHSEANPESKKLGLVRYQVNPTPFWGPGTRATAMVCDEKTNKSKKNQNKRKREPSEEKL
nr:probable tRNA (guanine(26)-N(2))-dimethyltransferase isoform X1 [Onthophagus taurus]XP_022916363.1 probable tRNA (guanine(26)-N(2))-dimethyltransferase isoform X1 [Onthophagus taurus]XP_022916364.1 probable tRNA (guanine(26)-N(2))-dimethyltransferase isoform X1 [Onthophagus taurus]XP_022916365.1 probable tRNA (guanine(26)-N(2))-dimethyltransferase isoform X1 [Onthophagus taurus]XP_022916366.1 probable tRNA (guanine(26)-N(2))-dimethyltransferase isoform X1 [Onthophagus taurus]XP_022916367.1 